MLLYIALRWLELDGVGEFTLVYTTVTLVLAVVRSLVLEPLLIRHSGEHEPRYVSACATGASAVVGVSVGAIVTVFVLLAGDLRAGGGVVAGALALPAVLVQDGYRFAMFARGRPWSAAVNDAVVLTFTVALVAVVADADVPHPWWIFAGWGVACSMAVLVAMAQTKTVASVGGGVSWLRENRTLGLQLAGSTAAQQAAGRASLYLVGAIAGVAALGVVAAARTLFSPLNTMLAASLAFAVPEAVRKKSEGRSLDRFLVQMSLVMGLFVGAVLLGLARLPDNLGRIAIGPNWEAAQPLLLPTALWIGGTALSQGARIGLRVLGRARTLLSVSAIVGGLVLVGSSVGAAVAGAHGAAWGFGIVSVLVQCLWWGAYWRARPRRTRQEGSVLN